VLAQPSLFAQTESSIKNVFWQPNDLQPGSVTFVRVELNRKATKVFGQFLGKDLLFFYSGKAGVWWDEMSEGPFLEPLVRRDLFLAGLVRVNKVLGNIHVTGCKRYGTNLYGLHTARHLTAGQCHPDPEVVGPRHSFDANTFSCLATAQAVSSLASIPWITKQNWLG
jgi:hypothetical protein